MDLLFSHCLISTNKFCSTQYKRLARFKPLLCMVKHHKNILYQCSKIRLNSINKIRQLFATQIFEKIIFGPAPCHLSYMLQILYYGIIRRSKELSFISLFSFSSPSLSLPIVLSLSLSLSFSLSHNISRFNMIQCLIFLSL